MTQVGPYQPLEADIEAESGFGAERLESEDRTQVFQQHGAPEGLSGTSTSQLFFACYGILIVIMLISCISVFSIEGLDAPCDRPLALWTVVHVCRHVVKGSLFACKQFARDRNYTSLSKIIVLSIKATEIFGLVWWLKGANWLYKSDHCSTWTHVLMAVFFSIQTLFLLIPCFVLLMLCTCLPIIIWVLPIFVPQNPNQQATSEETIEKISKFAWNAVSSLEHFGNLPSDSEEMRLAKMCSICLSEFEDGQEVMEMPCDKRHLFHAHCVSQWLRTSQNCPLCRSNIPQKIDESDEGRSQP